MKNFCGVALLSCLLFWGGALGSGYSDIDGDTVRDDIDLCAGTTQEAFRSGMVKTNGCADYDGDNTFPRLPETHAQFDANDKNGCRPNKGSKACKTNDTDSDGYANSVDPDPRNACNPNKNSVACTSKKESNYDSEELLAYIDPYAITKKVTKTYRNSKRNTIEPLQEGVLYISNKKALRVIQSFDGSASDPLLGLQAQKISLYDGMKDINQKKSFTYYNTVVGVLNILETHNIIGNWKQGYAVEEDLEKEYITEKDFAIIMKRLKKILSTKKI